MSGRQRYLKAARAVLEDLLDRRGIKWELAAVRRDHPETWTEIETTLSKIIQKEVEGT